MNVTPSLHSHPILDDVFELLHRMELCQTGAAFQWMARDALQKLRQYEAEIRNADVTH
jgi:hypothetical protein